MFSLTFPVKVGIDADHASCKMVGIWSFGRALMKTFATLNLLSNEVIVSFDLLNTLMEIGL